METIKKVTRYHHVVDEKEALRLEDKFRRSLKREGERIGFSNGFSNGEKVGFSNGEKVGFSNGEKVGFSNGFTDGIISMIKSMFDNHMDIETISKVSNKSVGEIEKIISK